MTKKKKLTEAFNTTMPKWLKKALRDTKSGTQSELSVALLGERRTNNFSKLSTRGVNSDSDLYRLLRDSKNKETVSRNYRHTNREIRKDVTKTRGIPVVDSYKAIALDTANFISGDIPTSPRDPRLLEPNIPFFYLGVKQKHWSAPSAEEPETIDLSLGSIEEQQKLNKRIHTQVYAKGYNDDEVFEIIDADDRENKPFKYISFKQLSKYMLDFCYLDGTLSTNFIQDKRIDRQQNKKALGPERNKEYSQRLAYPIKETEVVDVATNKPKIEKEVDYDNPFWMHQSTGSVGGRQYDKNGYIINDLGKEYKDKLTKMRIGKYAEVFSRFFTKIKKLRDTLIIAADLIDIESSFEEFATLQSIITRGYGLLTEAVGKYHALEVKLNYVTELDKAKKLQDPSSNPDNLEKFIKYIFDPYNNSSSDGLVYADSDRISAEVGNSREASISKRTPTYPELQRLMNEIDTTIKQLTRETIIFEDLSETTILEALKKLEYIK